MGTVGKLVGLARKIAPVWVDRVLAVVFTVGAIADAGSQPQPKLGAIAVGSLVAMMGSIAWRHTDPVRTTAIAVSGLIVFTVTSRYNGDGSFEVAAIALNFYSLGRGSPSRLVCGALLLYWLAGVVVVGYVPSSGTVAQAAGAWGIAGVLPFAFGRILERRSELTRELAAGAKRLRDEQEIRARRAAAEERNRMARELHDVIAHCLSVMVVQTGAARRVADADIDAAREALGIVVRSGREALVELRRMVGVLRRGSEESVGSSAPGLDQLNALAERSRAAGLPVAVRVEGESVRLPPELDLVAYRIVQEALTNAIKHAGPAHAEVGIAIDDGVLQLTVSDTGRGSSVDSPRAEGSGQGIVGMTERANMYGGELHAGPRPGRGFQVEARIPLGGIEPVESDTRILSDTEARLRWRWLDPLLAGITLVVLEIAVLSSNDRRGPLALSVLAVAGIALAAIWRRRTPLVFLLVVAMLGAVMNSYLVPLKSSALIGAYFVLVPSYTVAAWAEAREALLGLALLVGGAAVSELIVHRGRIGDFAGGMFVVLGAWAAGRAIRSYRLLTAELRSTSARLALEREDRARLAVAGERSRIARELHAAVARSVAAMVVQAEAALSLLGRDSERADATMSTVEGTGRLALAEMRRVLGVLRHGDGRGELTPQPGIAEIYALIQRARDGGQSVELSIDGDAGTLAAGVELGLYRILENALQSARKSAVGVSLHFGEQELELRLTGEPQGPNGWPTDAMRERVALCGGQLDADLSKGDRWRLRARMPRGIEGAVP